GYDIVKESLKAKANIGYVPQDIALLEELSAYDNLEFFGALYGLKGKLLKERIKEALEVTGLEDKRKQKVKKFSGGMKRRLNIATAIMHHPKVLIMDEPTVGVDPQSRNHIFTFTKKICKEWGTTVIYTSHYMEEVEELCERVFIIDLGKEIAYGNKEDIKSSVFPNNKVIIDASNMSGEALIKLENVEGILKIVDNENLITLTINSNFKLGNALNILEKENVIIKKISYEEAKLEDVFLTLTGKNLRD
ncbi:MAG: ATP-binding cassette domain-containing protein, partial [Clostridium paraputrificum]